ncbi:MAG: fructose-1,6-bisphosphatase [Rikenellaceae bacterium]
MESISKRDAKVFSEDELKYLKLLSKQFPNIMEASAEIINLETIINLPKGTEYFLTDLHGEHEAFGHVLRNASGVIREKIDMIFGNSIRANDKTDLCTLIYYPDQKIELVKVSEEALDDWYRTSLNQIIAILRTVSSKYTRSKVRKCLPTDFAYIIEELLYESNSGIGVNDYSASIISSIISVGSADRFIISICKLIQRLTIDHLHIVGDVYDRGSGAHIIMDQLCAFHNLDIQWGNHDIAWMGAAAGNLACIANIVRVSLRYANLEALEDGYGINLLPLATFAMENYGTDPCKQFSPKINQSIPYSEKTLRLLSQMHKAISIIQFKLEGEIKKRRPEFEMDGTNVLEMVDYDKWVFKLDGEEFPLNDTNFPTVDPQNPCCLTVEEEELMTKLRLSFSNSEKLDKHIRCLYSKGSLYLSINNNLLYHASVPLNEDGSLKELRVGSDVAYKGKALLDKIDSVVRKAFFGRCEANGNNFALDYMWYLWCGKDSPLYGKDKMCTFERYFIDDKRAHKEVKGAYYSLIDNFDVCASILREFNLNPEISHIINGHIPVKLKSGESPIKAGGKLLVIDGGFSKSYQTVTGTAGYTLIFNSQGLKLVHHEPFESTQKAIEEGIDIHSTTFIVESKINRIKVKDTNIGAELCTQIESLKRLLSAYRSGVLKVVNRF